jgi:flagellar motor switch/type III secretory pathway protein FliN
LQFAGSVNESALVPAEIQAIQAAIREVASPGRVRALGVPSLPTALPEAAAVLLERVTRWAERAPRALRHHLPGPWRLEVESVDVVEPGALEHEVARAWTGVALGGGEPVVMLAIDGAIIEHIAARRCGEERKRPLRRAAGSPSATALQLFAATGGSALHSWIAVWNADGGGELSAAPPSVGNALANGFVEAARGAGSLLRATLAWSGSVQGSCTVYAAASALTPSRARDVGAVLETLAEVPVEVRVELGTLQLSPVELRQLRPGATLPLPTFVDARLPIFVGGVLKAWGRPVVRRGVLAIAIEQVVGERGGRS